MATTHSVAPWAHNIQKTAIEEEHLKLVGDLKFKILSGFILSILIPLYLTLLGNIAGSDVNGEGSKVYKFLLNNLDSISNAVNVLGFAGLGGLIVALIFPLLKESGRVDSDGNTIENPTRTPRVILLSKIQRVSTITLMILFFVSFSMNLPILSGKNWDNLGESLAFGLLAAFTCGVHVVQPKLFDESILQLNACSRKIDFFKRRIKKGDIPHERAGVWAITRNRVLRLHSCGTWVPFFFLFPLLFSIFNENDHDKLEKIAICAALFLMSWVSNSFFESFAIYALYNFKGGRATRLELFKKGAKKARKPRGSKIRNSRATEKVRDQRSPEKLSKRDTRAQEGAYLDLSRHLNPWNGGNFSVLSYVAISLTAWILISIQGVTAILVSANSEFPGWTITTFLAVTLFLEFLYPMIRKVGSGKVQFELKNLHYDAGRHFQRIKSHI